jgi:hypothetical protein
MDQLKIPKQLPDFAIRLLKRVSEIDLKGGTLFSSNKGLLKQQMSASWYPSAFT